MLREGSNKVPLRPFASLPLLIMDVCVSRKDCLDRIRRRSTDGARTNCHQTMADTDLLWRCVDFANMYFSFKFDVSRVSVLVDFVDVDYKVSIVSVNNRTCCPITKICMSQIFM